MANLLREALEKARRHYIQQLTSMNGQRQAAVDLERLPFSELKDMWKREVQRLNEERSKAVKGIQQ